MLNINNLHASIGNNKILNGIDLTIKKGEIHVIMGPNGSGKSTLSKFLAGENTVSVLSGSLSFLGKNILNNSPEERALMGIFLAFQYPVEIPGVSNAYFLRAIFNAQRKYRGEKEIDSFDFLKLIKEKIKRLGISEDFLHRFVNVGFSGGEKKKNEILQMSILQPELCILDEIDSGLDIDAMGTISSEINLLKSNNRSIILVTHYQRLLNYVVPDFVHVLMEGKIIKSGDFGLAKELEAKGYAWLIGDDFKC